MFSPSFKKTFKFTDSAFKDQKPKIDFYECLSTASSSKKNGNWKSFKDPSDEMQRRWLKIIESEVPILDLSDISASVNPLNAVKR